MKKFLFVALVGGALVACNNASTTEGGVDTSSQAYKDSVAAATAPTTTPETTAPMMGDTTNKMMGDTSSNKMIGDSMK